MAASTSVLLSWAKQSISSSSSKHLSISVLILVAWRILQMARWNVRIVRSGASRDSTKLNMKQKKKLDSMGANFGKD